MNVFFSALVIESRPRSMSVKHLSRRLRNQETPTRNKKKNVKITNRTYARFPATSRRNNQNQSIPSNSKNTSNVLTKKITRKEKTAIQKQQLSTSDLWTLNGTAVKYLKLKKQRRKGK